MFIFSVAQQAETIPKNLRKHFRLHDCIVLSVEKRKDITILLDSSGGFTEENRLIFHDAIIIQEDKAVDGCWWIYEELYKTQDGYEVHMMFADETNSFIELTIIAKSITIDKT